MTKICLGRKKKTMVLFETCRSYLLLVLWGDETPVQPISLLELGKWMVEDKPLFIGAAIDYKRRFDVVLQVELERPQQVVHDSLDGVIEEATKWAFRRRHE